MSFSSVSTGDIFTDAANSQGTSWIDIDNDGLLDLFVANVGNQVNFLYRNQGDGGFQRILSGDLATDQFGTIGSCWADYDNDGDLDVFASGSTSAFYKNDGSGNFTRTTNTSVFGFQDMRGWACAWADYDLDGFADLIITHPAGFLGVPFRSNLLFRNTGDGMFERITDTPITEENAAFTVATWSDYDQDGDSDLFIGSGPASATAGPDYLYRNLIKETGTASFERITEGELASTARDGQVINWIDYDNDGDLDVFVTNWGGNMGGGLADELFRNDGESLTRITSGLLVTEKQVSLASVWGDFDNDSDLDVFIADGSGNRANRLFENNGDGTFTKRTESPVGTDINVSWGATAGDYDNDGDLDLFVSNAQNGSRNFLYRNDLAAGRHWLKVHLQGETSNRTAIGSRVKVKAVIDGQATWQLREVSSQNSFNGHNSFVVHVGLLDAQIVDTLQIEWPSGQIDLYEAVSVDQFLQVTEGGIISPVANDEEPEAVPTGLYLEAAFPNPFTERTTITYSLPEATTVSLVVYDLLGRRVQELVNMYQSPGVHSVQWNAGLNNTKELSSGVYMYRLQTSQGALTRLVQFLR